MRVFAVLHYKSYKRGETMRVAAYFFALGTTEEAKAHRARLVEKYKACFIKSDDFLLSMYTDRPEYKELMQELQDVGLDGSGYFVREWTKKEIDTAEYLVLSPVYDCEDAPSLKDYNASFEPICSRCRVLKQTADLKIKKKYAGKWDFFSSYEFRRIASPRLRELLEQEGVPGVSFRPVYTVKVEEPVGWQLLVDHTLPPVHPDSQLQDAVNCPECGFRSYVLSETEPLTYGHEIREIALDGFNRTHESFGGGIYCRPITIVSQNVRQLFLQHKIKANFEPVIIKENS